MGISLTAQIEGKKDRRVIRERLAEVRARDRQQASDGNGGTDGAEDIDGAGDADGANDADGSDGNAGDRVAALTVEVSRRKKERKHEPTGPLIQILEVQAAAAYSVPNVPWCGGCTARTWHDLHWHCVGCGGDEDGMPARQTFHLGDLMHPLLFMPKFEQWRCGECRHEDKPASASIPALATPFQLWWYAVGVAGTAALGAQQARADPTFAKWLERAFGFKLPPFSFRLR